MPRGRFALAVAVVLAAAASLVPDPSRPLAAQAEEVIGYEADSTLTILEPMIGRWLPMGLPDSLARLDPPIVAHEYGWTVGRRAVRIREGFRADDAASAQLEGLVYWNPATERIEFVAVAGHGAGEGRLFQGEYAQLEDGRIQRIYDVFYRDAADVPGEAFGGTRRRYREIYRFVRPDSVSFTLEWFHDGAWRGFGRFAEGSFTRMPSVPDGDGGG